MGCLDVQFLMFIQELICLEIALKQKVWIFLKLKMKEHVKRVSKQQQGRLIVFQIWISFGVHQGCVVKNELFLQEQSKISK